jgi:hypothetical protein
LLSDRPLILSSQRPIDELRARGAELRRMAETATTADVKAALLQVADRYNRLAAQLAEKEDRGLKLNK